MTLQSNIDSILPNEQVASVSGRCSTNINDTGSVRTVVYSIYLAILY